MRHFTVTADLNVAQKCVQHGDLYRFPAYFIQVYVGFIIVKTLIL